MSAGGTRATGVAWIYQAHLKKCPGVPLVAMFASNRCSLSNPTEVFKRDCLARYRGFLDDLLANHMIGVGLEARLAATHLAQTALRVLRVDLLQPLAAQVVAVANKVNDLAGEVFPLAIGGEIYDAEIDAQRPAVWLSFTRRFLALCHMQVVHPVAPDQISAADFPRWINQHGVLAWAQNQAADDTPLQRVEGDVVQAHQAVGPRIVADTSAWTKCWARVALLDLYSPDRFNGLGPGADGQLRAQAEPFARFAIDTVMRRVGVGDAFIPAHSRDPGGGLIEGVLRRSQRYLVAVNAKLAADSAGEGFVHTDVFCYKQAKTERRGGASSPA
jgi:hypothetical protein